MRKIPLPASCWSLAVCMAVLCAASSLARPYKDSPIKRIIVPYNRYVVSGRPYQYPKVLGENRNVLVPEHIEIVPTFELNKGTTMTMSSRKGIPVNFADGAYPVYYMPSNVNGKFNGKISLLT